MALAVGCARQEAKQGTAEAPSAKAPQPAANAGAEGSMAPEFELPDLAGKKVRLSDFKGKVVIVDFWATWCGPCRYEIPHFVRMQERYKDKGFEIVGLSLDAEGASAVTPFAAKNKINYTMLIATNDTADLYGGVLGIPTTFVIDRQGRIVKKFVGAAPPEAFEQVIQPLLAS